MRKTPNLENDTLKVRFLKIRASNGVGWLCSLMLVASLAMLFILLTKALNTDGVVNYDQEIAEYVMAHRTATLTYYFVLITHFGDVYGYLMVLILWSVLAYRKSTIRKPLVQATLVLLFATTSNLLLKQLVNRARPAIEHLVTVETLSYPSGHAMSAMAFYGFLMYLLFQSQCHTLFKTGGMLVLFFLILSIGTSRIYLGVHFPSDIAGGYLGGLIGLMVCVLIFNLTGFIKNPDRPTT